MCSFVCRSVGCIFAELLGRKPLFPGKDYVHQLNLITRVGPVLANELQLEKCNPVVCKRKGLLTSQVIGSPAENELGFISSDKARRYIRSLPRAEPTDFFQLWPSANPKVGICFIVAERTNCHKMINVWKFNAALVLYFTVPSCNQFLEMPDQTCPSFAFHKKIDVVHPAQPSLVLSPLPRLM